LPPGKCLQITFRGPDGAVTGTATCGVPGTFQVPPGSTSGGSEVKDCDPQDGGSGAHGALLARAPISTHVRRISGWPLTFDESGATTYGNAFWEFLVTVDPGQDPWQVIEPILLGGPGTPVPPNVEVVYYSTMVGEAAGVRLKSADDAPFLEYRLDWNGQTGYADLAPGTNVQMSAASNGWNVAETLIPWADIDEDVGATNRAHSQRRVQGDPRVGVSLELTALE
jgi:hypothetical protein